MPKITLHNDSVSSVTSVSNIFIDEYMSDANGEFVKIYLYLLRLMNMPDTAVSLSSIADKFEHTEKDVKRALCYWERMKLLRLEYDTEQNLTGVHLLNSAARDGAFPVAAAPSQATTLPDREANTDVPQDLPLSAGDADVSQAATLPAGNTDVSQAATLPAGNADVSLTATLPAEDADIFQNTGNIQTAETAESCERAHALPEKKCYTADDIRVFCEKEPIRELIFIAERYLRRTLTQKDTDTLLYFYDGLDFSVDLIEYLIEYCVSSGHSAIRYIEAVALEWAKCGVHSVMDAKQITRLHGQTYFAVKKAFGISGRDLVPSEISCIERWRTDYGFSLEIITAACDCTIRTIQKPSFAYADSILSAWKKMQVRSIADVEKLTREHREKHTGKSSAPAENGAKNKFNNFKQRSYDYDQLEKMLLTTNVQ